MVEGRSSQVRLAAAGRLAITSIGFALICAWPLVLFKLRAFGG